MQSSVWLYMISGAAAYNTLTAQGPVKDYQLTFYSTPPSSLLRDKDQNQTRCVKGKNIFLFLLLIPVFISHTLSVPFLFTGTLSNPIEEYNQPVMIKAIIGLILGAYAAYQYTYNYLHYLVQEGLDV